MQLCLKADNILQLPHECFYSIFITGMNYNIIAKPKSMSDIKIVKVKTFKKIFFS